MSCSCDYSYVCDECQEKIRAEEEKERIEAERAQVLSLLRSINERLAVVEEFLRPVVERERAERLKKALSL